VPTQIDTTYDVVGLGEALLRLNPRDPQLLEQAGELEVHVGGSETNVLVGLARLGLRTAWISRMTDIPLGQLIGHTLRGQGVDTAHLTWTSENRVGLYFLARGVPPRASRVYYDRGDSAMAHMTPADLPDTLFKQGRAYLLHTSGITAADQPQCGTNRSHGDPEGKSGGLAGEF